MVENEVTYLVLTIPLKVILFTDLVLMASLRLCGRKRGYLLSSDRPAEGYTIYLLSPDRPAEGCVVED